MPALVIIAIALLIAAYTGGRRAGREVGKTYQRERERKLAAAGLADKAVAMGHGKRARRAGATAGALAATSVSGGRIAAHAFGRGWRLGWRIGRRRGAAWLERHSGPAPVADRDATPTATAPDAATPGATATPDTTATPPPAATSGPSSVAPATTTTPRTTSTKGKPMTTATAEITSRSALLKKLNEIKTEATAELEDAKGDEQRAKAEVADVDLAVASLRNFEIDEGSVQSVQALQDTNGARTRAVQARMAAAEARLAAASKAITAVTNSAQGQFHNN